VPYVDSMLALTLAMNVLTTSLIVYRIWSIEKKSSEIVATTSRSRRASRLRNVIRILIESAALYTISVIVFTCTYVAGSNANYGTSDNVVQIIGICFNLIIIRVDSGRSFQGTTQIGTTTQRQKSTSAYQRSKAAYPLSMFQRADPDSEISKPNVEVNIEREVDFMRDVDYPNKVHYGDSTHSTEVERSKVWNAV